MPNLQLGNLLTAGNALLAFPNKYSFNFDGSNDYLLLPADDNFGVNDTWSISFWFKSDSISTTQALFSASKAPTATNRIGIILHGSVVRFSIYGTFDGTSEYRAKSSTSLSSDTWYHLVATNSNGTLGLYINNVEQTNTSSYGISHSARRVIGADINFGLPFDGLIDEFAIWDTALSADDVAKIASKPVDFSKASTYATDRTSNLKLWLRAGDKVLPENDTAIARQDFYTDFDGTDDYISLDNYSLSPSGTYTISFWFKTGVSDAGAVYTNVDGTDNYISIGMWDGKIQMNCADSGGTDRRTTGTYNDNEWHHAVLIKKDTSTCSAIYIDGVLVPQDTNNTWYGTNTRDEHVIGRARYSTTEYYWGRNSGDSYLSKIGIWNTELDAQTISQMAKSRFTPMRDNRFSVVDFDGSDDFIDCGANVHDFSSGDFTISGWIFHDTSHNQHSGIVGVRDGSGTEVQFYIKYDDERLASWNGSTNVYGSSALSDGWSHVAMVQSGSNKKFYINGVLDNTASQANGSATSATFKIGYTGHLSERYLGSISSISVYNVEKSAEEIYAIYQQGITYDESSLSGLVGYWRMGDDTSASYPTIADSSSNSNDGTITNGASDDIVQQMVAGYDLGAFEGSEELSGELVTNGTFDSNIDNWSEFSSGRGTASWSNGRLRVDETTGVGNYYSSQAQNFYAGKVYKLSVDVFAIQGTETALKFLFGTSQVHTLNASEYKSGDTYTAYLIPTADVTSFLIGGNGLAEINELDNISIKEVLQSEVSDTYPAIIDVNEPVLGAEEVTNGDFSSSSDWTLNEASITGGVLDVDATQFTFFASQSASNQFTADVFNKIEFEVTEYTEGAFKIYGTGTDTGFEISSAGTHTFYYKPSSNEYIRFRAIASVGFDGKIDNVSVKQVFGNVGTMTNQDSSDLVYSSVLPDQSFLTGVNSAYNFLDFDGTDAYVSVSAINDNYKSISFWFNLGSNATSSTHYNTFGAIGAFAGSFSFITIGGGATSSVTNELIAIGASGAITAWESNSDTITGNVWHHLAIVWNGSKYVIYYDGELKDTTSGTGTHLSLQSNQTIMIGRNRSASSYYKDNLTSYSIFNKSLSASEVSAIYTAGRHTNLLDSYSDNLLLFLAFGALDATTGLADTDSTIYDRSGNSNHGTTSGTATGDLKSPPNAEPNGYAKGDTNRSTTTP